MKDIATSRMRLTVFVKGIGDFTLVLPNEENGELRLVRGEKTIAICGVDVNQEKDTTRLKARVKSILKKKLSISKSDVVIYEISNKDK